MPRLDLAVDGKAFVCYRAEPYFMIAFPGAIKATPVLPQDALQLGGKIAH